MKKLIGIAVILAFGATITACDDRHRIKHKDKYHKGKVERHHGKSMNRLPGDNQKRAPNCAADGPGCRQFNPNL